MADNENRSQVVALAGTWLGSVTFLAAIKLLGCAPECLRWRHIAAAVWMPVLWVVCFGAVAVSVALIRMILEARRR